MSTATTRKPVIPGAAADAAPVQPAQAEPAFTPPKADQPRTDVERIAQLEEFVAYLRMTVRQLVKDVRAMRPVGDAEVRPEKEMLPYDEAVELARKTGKFVLSDRGHVGPIA
jgi:hypothetical protein